MSARTKNRYLVLARDLCYPGGVISQIKSARSEEEITRILTTARSQRINQDESRTRSRIVSNFTPHSRGVVTFASTMALR